MAERKRRTRTIRPLRSGQITIPADFRRELGITDDSLLQMTIEGNALHITKMHTTPNTAGSPWLVELYERFAPVRQEALDRGYTEGEINDAIDAALAAVRRRDG